MENENSGLQLLKKGHKGFMRLVFSRMGIVLLLLLFNFGLLFSFFIWFEEFLPQYFGGSLLFTICMVLYLLNSRADAYAKITWLVLIMIAPVFGSLLYLFTQTELGHRALLQRVQTVLLGTKDLIGKDADAQAALEADDPGAGGLARYISHAAGSRVFQNTDVTYFPLGEDKFRQLLVELEKAEKFIFLEYFIIDEGTMWGKVLEILARKAAQGVDVRVMYDGTCEFVLLPKGYPKKLKALGIQCKVFAPMTPFLSTHYNYRDHRKILVIDGHTAFNGGINLADEYINEKSRFGHWKDTAVMLKGEGVQAFTLMFLQMWNMEEKTGQYNKFLAQNAGTGCAGKGYVVPYGDCPLDSEHVGQRVYMDILSRAHSYVHIMTPYLILDEPMENALQYAAARGVEVKLLLPGIPDKKIPYALAKTHYRSLLDAGVQIYEYTPGFVHAKVFVCDDREAVVGTINLDYRILYHHFECATYMHSTACIGDIERDFQDCAAKSRHVTRETVKKEKLSVKLTGYLLKVIAPLL